MHTNVHEAERLDHGQLVYSIIGCAFDVLKGIGHGLPESAYENALVVEFGLRNLKVEQKRHVDVVYKGIPVSQVTIDLLVEGAVIVGAKVIDRVTDLERGQMLNYLRITGLRVGVIINFQKPKLEWERIIL